MGGFGSKGANGKTVGGVLNSARTIFDNFVKAPAATTPAPSAPQLMPVYNSPPQIESARRRRDAIIARSGRPVAGKRGDQPYQSSFLGNVS